MTSAVAGYLAPSSTPAPLEDDALDDFLGDVVAGVTGLDRNECVRPRWLEDPANIPDRDISWAAVGVTMQTADTYAAVVEGSDGLSQEFQRHETLNIVATFYGPNGGKFATLFRDGLLINQNQEALYAAGFGFLSVDGPTSAPELFKEKWLRRYDVVWMTRREVRRTYPVLSLLSAVGVIETDLGDFPFDIALQEP